MMSVGRHVSKLSGYAPALPTPFRPDGAVDYAAFEQICELQIGEGATALVVCGTTGEAPTLNGDEQRELVRIAARVARGGVPVIAGAGSNSTTHAIALARGAESVGADAVLSVVPYYNKPTQPGLLAHFGAIADATGLPIILYDVPARTVCGLADETVARLAERPQFIGLKDATGDLARLQRLTALVGPQFRLLSGDDATAPAFLALGGHGCISVTSNIVPEPVPHPVPGLPPGTERQGATAGASDRRIDRGAVSREQSGAAQVCPEPARTDVLDAAAAPGRAERAGPYGNCHRPRTPVGRIYRICDRRS